MLVATTAIGITATFLAVFLLMRGLFGLIGGGMMTVLFAFRMAFPAWMTGSLNWLCSQEIVGSTM